MTPEQSLESKLPSVAHALFLEKNMDSIYNKEERVLVFTLGYCLLGDRIKTTDGAMQRAMPLTLTHLQGREGLQVLV